MADDNGLYRPHADTPLELTRAKAEIIRLEYDLALQRAELASLRGLIEVEIAGAQEMGDSRYVNGRMAGYRFVLEAIDRRWPNLAP